MRGREEIREVDGEGGIILRGWRGGPLRKWFLWEKDVGALGEPKARQYGRRLSMKKSRGNGDAKFSIAKCNCTRLIASDPCLYDINADHN